MICHQMPAAWLRAGLLPHRLSPVTFAWTPDSPDKFDLHITHVRWSIPLALLADGVNIPAGTGEVFVCRTTGWHVEIVLDNGTARGALQVDLVDVDDFLHAVRQRRNAEAAQ